MSRLFCCFPQPVRCLHVAVSPQEGCSAFLAGHVCICPLRLGMHFIVASVLLYFRLACEYDGADQQRAVMIDTGERFFKLYMGPDAVLTARECGSAELCFRMLIRATGEGSASYAFSSHLVEAFGTEGLGCRFLPWEFFEQIVAWKKREISLLSTIWLCLKQHVISSSTADFLLRLSGWRVRFLAINARAEISSSCRVCSSATKMPKMSYAVCFDASLHQHENYNCSLICGCYTCVES